jgi:hypothetical protein
VGLLRAAGSSQQQATGDQEDEVLPDPRSADDDIDKDPPGQ